jgi:hypothetical protein
MPQAGQSKVSFSFSPTPHLPPVPDSSFFWSNSFGAGGLRYAHRNGDGNGFEQCF